MLNTTVLSTHLKVYLRNSSILISTALLLFFGLMVALSPLSGDPTKIDLKNNLQPPSTDHPFGTDHLGRDVLTRIVHAARIDLGIALVVVSLSAGIGVLIGLVSGLYGGIVDRIVVCLIDIFLALPELILALVIVGALGPGLLNSATALIILGWVRYARIVRGSVISIKEKSFVELARASGVGNFSLMFRHILPNVISPVVTLSMLHLGHAILSLASLGFLGLGAQPPTPEWGTMLSEGRIYLREAWWMSVFPGMAIMLTVLSFTLLGDGLRDIFDPKHRRLYYG
jgi:peptide/nickel transport system permease protein